MLSQCKMLKFYHLLTLLPLIFFVRETKTERRRHWQMQTKFEQVLKGPKENKGLVI